MITTTQVAKRFIGDGVTTVFAYPYALLNTTHLSITKDGDRTSAWTATLDDPGPGATVTMSSAPADGVVLVITRVTPWTQLTDFTPGEALNAETLETSLDKMTLILQEMAAQCGVQPNPLDAPSNLVVAATGTGDSLLLTWDNPNTDATHIEYQERNTGTAVAGWWSVFALPLWEGDAVTKTVVDAAKYTVGSTWQFRIRARREGLTPGEPTVISDWSNIDSATVT